MSAMARLRISQRAANLSDLCGRTKIAGTCASRFPSAQEMTGAAIWRRSTPPPFSSFSSSRGKASPSALIDRMACLPISGASNLFLSASAGFWRLPAAWKGRILTVPEPVGFYYAGRRVRQFGTAIQRAASLSDLGRITQISGPCSAQTMREASAPSSGGQASAPSCIDLMRRPSSIWHPLQFVGTSSRSLSGSAGWWQRQTSCNGSIALHEQARFFLSGSGQARQFGTANQREQQATKQHLFLVLDDHTSGFTIHKLGIDNELDVVCGSAETPLCLPEPPVIRLGPPTLGRAAQFTAIGSHIIAICPSTKEKPRIEGSDSVTLTFDTKTAMFNASSVLPGGLRCGYEVAITVRDKLYLFESFTDNGDGSYAFYFRGGLHCLAADPCDNENDWSWQSLSHCSPFFWSCTEYPPEFPFDPKMIIAHVVHPRTGTIFVSARGHKSWSTFSYAMRGSGQWMRRGDWVLPFKGPAHYDHDLDAWVGLHRHSVDTDADGYLCACSVVSGRQQPNWKIGRDMLFLKHTHWRHVDAKLVRIGERSKYCLVERLLPEGADRMKYVLRLITFSVKYDEDGDLSITVHKPARFYKAPSLTSRFDVQAFWM